MHCGFPNLAAARRVTLRYPAAATLIATLRIGALLSIGITIAEPQVAAQVTSPQGSTALQADASVRIHGRLDLVDGGFAIGQLLPSDRDESVRWQAEGFTQPFQFTLDAVRHIAIEAPNDSQPPPDEFACAFTSGNYIYGRLIELSAEQVVLESAEGQRISIDRQQVARLVRASPEQRSGRRTSIDDPGRSAPWQFDPSGQRWKPVGQGNVLAVDIEADGDEWRHGGALIRGRQLAPERLQQPAVVSTGEFVDLQLAAKCLLELDISWEETPQFNLALGIQHAHDSLLQATRLAVWDDELVLARELNDRLTLVPVLSVKDLAPEKRLQLMIYLDQPTGRVVIRDRSGKLLAEFPAPAGQPQTGPGVRLLTSEGTHVAQLSATSLSWDEPAMAGPRSGAVQIVLKAGETVEGAVDQLDAVNAMLSVQQEDAHREISLDDIEQLLFAAAVEPGSVRAGDEEAPLLHHVVTADGWYLQGQWLGVEADHLRLRIAGVEELVSVPLRRLESISATRREMTAESPVKPSRTAQLVTDSAVLQGKIASSDPEMSVPQLRWQPDGSVNAAPLESSVDGQIVYHTRRPPVEALADNVRAAPPQPRGLGGALLQIFGGAPQPARRVDAPNGKVRVVRDAEGPPTDRSPATLFLRTGDTIGCEITHIDERGIGFASPSVQHGFARHDQVKSVILADLTQPKQISEATRRRLLMVPRMRRDDPPSHLICSRTGDFLRGRLLAMDDEFLRIEVRLETRVIPRDRIAQIFWMHPDQELTKAEPAAGLESPPEGQDAAPRVEETANDPQRDAAGKLRVQALRRDGTRMTFDFHACRDETVLIGYNELLGDCQVDVLQLDRLLLGKAIEWSTDASPLALWRLYDAPIPKAFLPGAGDGEAGASGTESALVGKPAPEFELELLSGEKFRLSNSRGRVVVLDFWASWCGPCIQAMPQIESVVGDFPDGDVQLIAINLQEPAATITAALERMDLDVTVVMDRNGSVAEQYGVTAIPQTVIVAPDGDVARLYVGIQASTVKEMRTAITELLQRDEREANEQP